MPNIDGETEIMLKTIRLSKNMFSLTERLPKAKYRTPKVFGGGSINQDSNSLLPILNNKRVSVQPDDNKPIIKTVKK